MSASLSEAAAVTIPLSKLIPSPDNVRKTGGGTGIEDLAASIVSHGVLQNLIVRPAADDTKGRFEVVAGGRRLAALQSLAKGKRIAKSYPVPCVVREPETATELSLAENTKRLAMHPADEFEAFRALADQGHEPAAIALRFGVQTRHVAQRMKLANVSPKLIALFRADGMSLDHLMALAITDDHEAQERVWAQTGTGWHPNSIKRRLTEADIAVTDKRARFVGLEAYEAAGGSVKRDLFSDDDDGWIEDATLLDRLATEKLTGMVPALEAEGWKWVQVSTGYPGPMMQQMRRLYAQPIPLTDEEEAHRSRLAEEWDELASRADGGGLTEEEEARHTQVDAELAAFEKREEGVFSAKQKAGSGAFLYLDPEGAAQVQGGYMRPEDEPKPGSTEADAEPLDGADEPDGAGAYGDEEAAGGAGLPRSEDQEEEPEASSVALSASLAAELQVHRTAAMQAMLAERPDLAFRLATYALAQQVFRLGYGGSCLSLHMTRPSTMAVPEIGESPAGQAMAKVQDRLGSMVPGRAGDLWDWLMAQDTATVSEVFAYCIAQGFDAGGQEWTGQGASALPSKVAQELGLRMGEWWTPTRESFFGKVTKATMLRAVAEAAGEGVAQRMTGLKKDAMAQAAEEAVKGTGWLPSMLRIPEPPTTD